MVQRLRECLEERFCLLARAEGARSFELAARLFQALSARARGGRSRVPPQHHEQPRQRGQHRQDREACGRDAAPELRSRDRLRRRRAHLFDARLGSRRRNDLHPERRALDGAVAGRLRVEYAKLHGRDRHRSGVRRNRDELPRSRTAHAAALRARRLGSRGREDLPRNGKGGRGRRQAGDVAEAPRAHPKGQRLSRCRARRPFERERPTAHRRAGRSGRQRFDRDCNGSLATVSS